MAIYHCTIKVKSAKTGNTAIGFVAYRSASKLYDEEAEKFRNFTYKKGVIHSEIMLPENAPERLRDRETLWNEVQGNCKQYNSQFAREFECGLPNELSYEECYEIVRNYVYENFTSKGMPADWSIHDKETSQNPNKHVHITTPTVALDENGEWQKAKRKTQYALDENGERIPIIDPDTGEQKLGRRNEKLWKRETVYRNPWDDQGNAEKWRASWAEVCNRYLSPENQIDHRSYAEQGIEKIPTIHEGHYARMIEEQGGISERCEYNRQVKAANKEIEEQDKVIEGATIKKFSLLKKLVNLYQDFKNPDLEKPPQFGIQAVDRALTSLWERRTKWLEARNREEQKEKPTGYTAIDELIRRANVRKDAEAQTRDPNRGKGRGKDDNTLTH